MAWEVKVVEVGGYSGGPFSVDVFEDYNAKEMPVDE